MLFVPSDIEGIDLALEKLTDQRRDRATANRLMNLFNTSGVTSVKYQGKDGRGVLLESLDQLETLKEVLGSGLSTPDQVTVVVNLRAKAWEALQEKGRMSPITLQNEEDAREALIARKMRIEYEARETQMQSEREYLAADPHGRPVPPRRKPKWYMENGSGDVVDLDLDALEPGSYVCQSGSEWITAEEAGLVEAKPPRRKPAKRKAKPEAEAEAAESTD
jgi:hypothetical protein